ncbi:MAG: protein kinase, partial [Acidobacteriota bacterium]
MHSSVTGGERAQAVGSPDPTDVAGEIPQEIAGHRILHLLGEGGMGCVYLAYDEALDRQVAVKIVSPHLSLDAEAKARFLREARVMATLVHPHVLRIYAAGKVSGQPYFVMEYVPGESLAARISREKRLAIDDALRILGQCVEALQAAWQCGIVHRDVKPSNILLDEHGRVRVADFGLAKPTQWEDEISLSDAGLLMCTPYYVSPEQARGEVEVDFRCDIYSMCIVLFEMLTGERPFRGGNAMAVVLKNIHAPLPDLRALRPEVSEELAALVEWMTRKAPEARPGSYEEIGAALGRLARTAAGEAADRPASRESYAPPFVEPRISDADETRWFAGREAELAELSRWLDAALSGRRRIGLVRGEAGTGKTALAGEFVRRALDGWPELVALSVNCGRSRYAAMPFGPFRQALAQLTGEIEPARRAGLLSAEQTGRLWSVLPSAAMLLAEPCSDLLATMVEPKSLLDRLREIAAPGTPWAERLRSAAERALAHRVAQAIHPPVIYEQSARLLESLVDGRPMLLTIDDLHWCDAASVALLGFLVQRLAVRPLLIVGTYRASEAERESAPRELADLLSQIEREDGAQIDLERTRPREFVDAVIDLEPNRLGEEFRQRFCELTGGHALFTVEMLRAMQLGKLLRRGEDGAWTEIEELDWNLLPPRIDALIRERMRALSPRARRVLAVGSIEGETVTAEIASRALGIEPHEVVHMLSEELGRHGRLVGPGSIERIGERRLSRYRFRHVLFRDFLYNGQDEAERAYLHEAVGSALEDAFAGALEQVAGELALHFTRAGRIEKAIEHSCGAGREAWRVSAISEALQHFETALELMRRLPESEQRDRLELQILLGMTLPLSAVRMWASARLSDLLNRAEMLA